MALINPHINFNGNAEEAFIFYKSVFGGEFAKIMRFKDLSTPEFPVAEKEANKIMHIALAIGKNILMANDVPESMGRTNENEHRSKISISAESKEEADKFGIEWMVDFDPKYDKKISRNNECLTLSSSGIAQMVSRFSGLSSRKPFQWLIIDRLFKLSTIALA